MKLIINGEQRDLININAFRAEHGLPMSFGVAAYEPKDFTGLASIDKRGVELNMIRAAMLDAIPHVIPFNTVMSFTSQLSTLFCEKLIEHNSQINLKEAEIDFAVAGLEGVLSALSFAIIRAKTSKTHLPDFSDLYQTWLDESVRVSQHVHIYKHNDAIWQINIINFAYGRIGLLINTPEMTYYVRDAVLACPVEGYMYTLMKDISIRILDATT